MEPPALPPLIDHELQSCCVQCSLDGRECFDPIYRRRLQPTHSERLPASSWKELQRAHTSTLMGHPSPFQGTIRTAQWKNAIHSWGGVTWFACNLTRAETLWCVPRAEHAQTTQLKLKAFRLAELPLQARLRRPIIFSGRRPERLHH